MSLGERQPKIKFPGPPGWELGIKLTTLSHKTRIVITSLDTPMISLELINSAVRRLQRIECGFMFCLIFIITGYIILQPCIYPTLLNSIWADSTLKQSHDVHKMNFL